MLKKTENKTENKTGNKTENKTGSRWTKPDPSQQWISKVLVNQLIAWTINWLNQNKSEFPVQRVEQTIERINNNLSFSVEVETRIKVRSRVEFKEVQITGDCICIQKPCWFKKPY